MLSKCDYVDGIGEYADDVGGLGGEYVVGIGKYVGGADTGVMNMLMDSVNLSPRILYIIRGVSSMIMLKNQVMYLMTNIMLITMVNTLVLVVELIETVMVVSLMKSVLVLGLMK